MFHSRFDSKIFCFYQSKEIKIIYKNAYNHKFEDVFKELLSWLKILPSDYDDHEDVSENNHF